MNISNILNPVTNLSTQVEETQAYKTAKPLGKVTDLLEQIYQQQPCPSTELLQGLLKKYPVIPSLVYLRSWFNNRHNKHKRQMNVVRGEKLEDLIRKCEPEIKLNNDNIIDLRVPVDNPDHFHTMVNTLANLQDACAAYLDCITKFDGPKC